MRTRSSVHQCRSILQPTRLPLDRRHGISGGSQGDGIARLPDMDGAETQRSRFKSYPLGGSCPRARPEGPTSTSPRCRPSRAGSICSSPSAVSRRLIRSPKETGPAGDRTAKFAFAQLVQSTGKMEAAQFLRALILAVPYRIHIVLTDNSLPRT
jgi:hypothetical protein